MFPSRVETERIFQRRCQPRGLEVEVQGCCQSGWQCIYLYWPTRSVRLLQERPRNPQYPSVSRDINLPKLRLLDLFHTKCMVVQKLCPGISFWCTTQPKNQIDISYENLSNILRVYCVNSNIGETNPISIDSIECATDSSPDFRSMLIGLNTSNGALYSVVLGLPPRLTLIFCNHAVLTWIFFLSTYSRKNLFYRHLYRLLKGLLKKASGKEQGKSLLIKKLVKTLAWKLFSIFKESVKHLTPVLDYASESDLFQFLGKFMCKYEVKR